MKKKEVAALKYDGDVPRLIIKGHGELAELILKVAAEAEIPAYQNKGLVQSLKQLKEGQAIPEELYEAVAEVIAWVYQLEDRQL